MAFARPDVELDSEALQPFVVIQQRIGAIPTDV